jgi:hypothetical protein
MEWRIEKAKMASARKSISWRLQSSVAAASRHGINGSESWPNNGNGQYQCQRLMAQSRNISKRRCRYRLKNQRKLLINEMKISTVMW